MGSSQPPFLQSPAFWEIFHHLHIRLTYINYIVQCFLEPYHGTPWLSKPVLCKGFLFFFLSMTWAYVSWFLSKETLLWQLTFWKKKMFCVFKWDFPLSQAVTDHWDLDPFPVDAASFNSISPFCMLVSVCLLSYNLHLSVGILFSLYIMKTA